MNHGRKFAVVIIASIQLTLCLVAGIIGAYMEVELPWLSVVTPILAAVYPTYMAANAVIKKKGEVVE